MARGKKGKKSDDANETQASCFSEELQASEPETNETVDNDMMNLSASTLDEISNESGIVVSEQDISDKRDAFDEATVSAETEVIEETSIEDHRLEGPLNHDERDSSLLNTLGKETDAYENTLAVGDENEKENYEYLSEIIISTEMEGEEETEEEAENEERNYQDEEKVVDDLLSFHLNSAIESEDEDDDFGSFDEASFEEFQAAPEDSLDSPSTPSKPMAQATSESITHALDIIFPPRVERTPSRTNDLLSPKAEEYFLKLSEPRRLHPPNWTKSKLRHNLLLQLGIPINLDEISNNTVTSRMELTNQSSTTENDLDWSKFEIPESESLGLAPDEKQDLIERSTEIFSAIETDIMSNTSELHLQKCSPEELDRKLSQMQNNYNQLIRISSIWHERIKDLKASQEVFESVMQNMVGYNQKIQRNELLGSLRRSGTKRGKKTF